MAIATVIGQVASFVACAVYFVKPKNFHLTKHSFLIDLAVFRKLIVLGGATFITQISIVVMSVLSNVTLFYYVLCQNTAVIFRYLFSVYRSIIMKMYSDTYDEARASYYQNISGKEWKDIKNYDLCLDTSLGKEATAKFIVDYLNKRKANKV